MNTHNTVTETSCFTCAYFAACGLRNPSTAGGTQNNCSEYRKDIPVDPPPWREMSYYKYPAYGTFSQQARLRREWED